MVELLKVYRRSKYCKTKEVYLLVRCPRCKRDGILKGSKNKAKFILYIVHEEGTCYFRWASEHYDELKALWQRRYEL